MPRRKTSKNPMKRSLVGTIVKIVLASKIALLGAFYFGAKNPGPVRRLEDSLFYRNVPIARESFPDPAGVSVVQRINEYGEKEAWLVHGESGREYEIGENLLPRDLKVIEKGLEERLGRAKSQRRVEENSAYTPGEACERIEALTRRIKREMAEYLTQSEAGSRAASRAIEVMDGSPYEGCGMLIETVRNSRNLAGQVIGNCDSYIEEISGINSRSDIIPPEVYESAMDSFAWTRERMRESIPVSDMHIEKLLGIRKKILENQNL